VLDVIFGGLAAGGFFCNEELRINTYITNFILKKRGSFFKRNFSIFDYQKLHPDSMNMDPQQ
jgi:hypothetical protein